MWRTIQKNEHQFRYCELAKRENASVIGFPFHIDHYILTLEDLGGLQNLL